MNAHSNQPPQDLHYTPCSTLAVDTGLQLTQVEETNPPTGVEGGCSTLQQEVVAAAPPGAGNYLQSLLTSRSQPSVGSADFGRNSADLRWTPGSSRDPKCNTVPGGVEECNVCRTTGAVSSRTCGGNTRREGSSPSSSNRDPGYGNACDAAGGTEGWWRLPSTEC